MKHVISALALLASFSAFVVFVGGGLLLLIIEGTGQKAAGAFIAAAGAVGSLAALGLVFAKDAVFDRTRGTLLAAVVALLALLPVAVLGLGALQFAGFPLGTTTPLVDWSIFAAGVVLALGALSILGLGYLRIAGRSTRMTARESAPWGRDARSRPPSRAPTRRPAEQLDDDVRVTHV